MTGPPARLGKCRFLASTAKILSMTSIVTSSGSKIACIAGLGISIKEDFQLAPGITMRPNPPRFDLQVIADGCEHLRDYASVIEMMEIANFYLEVQNDAGGKELAAKTWNSLWLFPLLSLACQSPCTSLYSWSGNEKVHFATATPHLLSQAAIRPIDAPATQLEWASKHFERFDTLQRDATFSKALMSYTNSHHLFGYSSRIMQLWSGIECLFRVSSEITRTVAMYSALLLDGGGMQTRGSSGLRKLRKSTLSGRKSFTVRLKVKSH